MLLNKSKFSEGDVITMKLSSGEEVLGRYIEEDMSSITIAKALMIAMTPKGPAMAPILMTVDPEKNLTINKSLISIMSESDKEIANQYMFQTTGIQPVSAGSIIK
jgi:hypothetical protein